MNKNAARPGTVFASPELNLTHQSNFVTGHRNILPIGRQTSQSRPGYRRLNAPKQLDLLFPPVTLGIPSAPPDTPPDTPISFRAVNAPGTPKYEAWCNYSGLRYGGRFSGGEIDIIARKFRNHDGPVVSQSFARIAEIAIRQTQGFCHVPADRADRWVDGGIN